MSRMGHGGEPCNSSASHCQRPVHTALQHRNRPGKPPVWAGWHGLGRPASILIFLEGQG